ncbi:SDR family oxidoreductase [Pelagibacteraceae bacterium]|nr:SDR family oxidoreductase [Pelagibacteraceae bacterium]
MKKKVLILGASGMIGSGFMKEMLSDNELFVMGTYNNNQYFSNNKNYFKLDLFSENSFNDLFFELTPNYVINCVGITKHLDHKFTENEVKYLNAELPHILAQICIENNSKLIHISSDCVFSGKKGDYSENDETDANDLYGQTKAAGEVIDNNNITVRTSTIGFEVGSKNGLLEWFLSQDRNVKGYTKAFFSGLSNYHLSSVIREIFLKKDLRGLFNVSGEKISKYNLLRLIDKKFGTGIKIIEDNSTLSIDRSLNCNKLLSQSEYQIPKWETMIEGLKTQYV